MFFMFRDLLVNAGGYDMICALKHDSSPNPLAKTTIQDGPLLGFNEVITPINGLVDGVHLGYFHPEISGVNWAPNLRPGFWAPSCRTNYISQWLLVVLTLPETNVSPKNGWLEYYFPIEEAHFQGQAVSFREGIINMRHTPSKS